MSNLAVQSATSSGTSLGQIESVMIKGDLASLSEPQRLQYYKAVCESVGLNPLTVPFDYIRLNGRLVLYAKKDATEQLRKIHGVSIESVEGKTVSDVYIVTAKAKDKGGRTDSSTGAVNIAGLKGDNLANAIMKAETKSKRRVTLSICGLGLLDETELETIPELNRARITPAPEDALENYGVVDDQTYRIGFGQWKSRTLEQVYRDHGPEKIKNYIQYLEDAAKKKNVEMMGPALEFVQRAEEFLGAMENGGLGDAAEPPAESGF